jgi:hypothetical protein
MKTLTTKEYALLDCILRTGDFGSGDEGGLADTFEALDERGLVDLFYGPISRELDAEEPDAPDYGEEADPCVTAQGRLAMLCYRLMARAA